MTRDWLWIIINAKNYLPVPGIRPDAGENSEQSSLFRYAL